MPMKYKINILSELKDKGYNTNKLRKEKLLAEGVIQSLRSNKPISWINISKICKLLNCQPGDILEYVPEDINTTEQENTIKEDDKDLIMPWDEKDTETHQGIFKPKDNKWEF